MNTCIPNIITKRFSIWSIIGFALLYLFSSCHKPKNEYVGMAFKLPITITPSKDTINVGDTLNVEASIADSMREELSGNYYKLKNFDFKTRAGFLTFLNNSTSLFLSQQPGAVNSFGILNEIGSITPLSETFGAVKFLYENNTFRMKTKFVAKQKGLFAINFSSDYVGKNTQLNFIDLGQTASGGKKIAVLNNIWYSVNNGNTDFGILKNYSKLTSETYPTPDNINAEQQATYTFVVK